jgi:ribosome-associated translation inhibitor RaiA
MNIQFNTGNNIDGSDRQSDYFSTLISEDLKRYDSQMTRLEVHLSDQDNSQHEKSEIKCTLEARLKNLNPIVVTNQGNSHEEAIKGAIQKLKKSLDTVTGRLSTY